MKRLPSLVLIALFVGCSHATTVQPAPSVSVWSEKLAEVQIAISQGRFAEADSVLFDYSQRHRGTLEGREATYWRALIRLDPANRTGSPRAAMEQLDVYLADSLPSLHHAEAITLRRLAASLDSLNRVRDAPAAASPAVDLAVDADLASQRADSLQKEIVRLREQLDKTNAELDRIKKRLSEDGQKP